ncbi:MAG: 16S rRNA (cytidine(1402)-2'-O)-methyltransferase [Chloroflexi bacterium]|nr:16S rRNA (cytidine(1402)-2'-O)-methyltransferase [Chloroflexota bacterium]
MTALYLVSTPIGNLEDITLRALRVLREVDLIAAEDTRYSARLLRHYDISKKIVSLHEHNETRKIGAILHALDQGRTVALISDAGTPLLSDPGYKLVRAAINAGHEIVPVPGPSSILAALVASGLPTDRFLFLGFPPRKAAARVEWLRKLASESATLILFESPRRLAALLHDVVATLGPERPVVIARELTKMHETFWRGQAKEAARAFADPPPGEVVVMVGGAKADEKREFPPEMTEAALAMKEGGLKTSEIARLLAQLTGCRRREIYRWLLSEQSFVGKS